MIKKQLVYTDYNGNERTEDFYFNFNKAEMLELELRTPGGVQGMLERITREQDGNKLIDIWKFFILNSYGEKSPDGKRFVKSKEMRDAFEQTEAYSQLFIELSSNSVAAEAFINGIIPQPEAKN